MSAEGDMDGVAYGGTLGSTLDPDEGEEELASYLVPRLATYAPSTSPLSSSLASQVGEADGAAEEDHALPLSRQLGGSGSQAWDSGERSAAHAIEDDTVEGVALRASHGLPMQSSASPDEEAQANAGSGLDPFLTEMDAEDVDDWREEDEHDADEYDEEEADNTDAPPQTRSGTRRRGASAVPNYVNAFAHSRVKELLKYEGSSSIISKDAISAVSEAVALLTRDLVAMAAGEATKRHRKTVTYEDIARVAQLLDRFSFLAEVLPPVAASSSNALGAGNSIVIGSSAHSAAIPGSSSGTRRHGDPSVRSRSAHGCPGRNALQNLGESPPASARSKTAHVGVLGAAAHRSAVHPQPGAGLRQATLRF
ncbi:hypothetical protein, conserved [Leishmania donovani]|uniref:Histone-like transcription factor (CBF/NF-Y) and archaeal histone family protein n=1 Tax=Leishmania donovani TaxID=5661 RepID=A0A3S7X811_LEIDO|nr:hypothetical protein, conserved [Leishmania donovani]AYU82569.1 Histone-like transcription factor (CBF/NF-Y) and archaeal histone/Core histone H2A/H2B/H3/H4, putative [Leishmania donovani]TPP40119.1 Histone-like transcription factor (CBF/NF-Y) and archaeal histone family protein [Leishmania donovani]CBZ37691.1 hypothetical protein, conserved [Leishmania donovani]